MRQFLDFEKSVAELENKIYELQRVETATEINIAEELQTLTEKAEKQLRVIYNKLTPWQKVQVSRHAQRPHALDYIKGMIENFMPLAGDRLYAEDHAIIGGLGRFKGQSVVVIGIERGSDLDTRLKHNFGMARPEGYRKAQRLIKLAGQFNLPIIMLIDTPGAWPGIDAEQHGQAEAIAKSIETCLRATTPIVSVIIGEGGSGGAIALATADKILMLEHAIYSVISPEACSSILWRDASQAAQAAVALRLTAQDLLKFKLIDQIIEEPVGGAQRDPETAISNVQKAIEAAFGELALVPEQVLQAKRRNKFLAMGREEIN
ncbi:MULTISPECIES: acetyl-CoA carboxylase carboxyltransferase subunit alpha [unclassified Commensalibacter]|uniref:acetyl-CoA carboxylase carboxyltransferase subunit alpha n=1 Tax=unclassified Commensalibacter TaxID=2630218 RepID=UPI0018DB8D6A|nr:MULTISPECIES: acetyl-CoA carboxylase carboxyltransferase subunit alpha [unclassified Commensalibacter]MBH9969296.1 acetyl-CoA carboxylase carboxyltransferase subunit alpha [Commensalibacter sp. M0265]MBH9976651.1 acetyl-CoA carboxylase carboxyltransferase subunit alpha [Commensalibacter sp. M0266]MBH9992412.1 acetyl-CoA carboxylase carboxyltransferase subunit alpha [Commensalibacter sp. M0270]MBI0045827.1 acetyl-CoA carboxylase carboxyltransferase subunit alpha [Commensalibacter sp. M0267]M